MEFDENASMDFPMNWDKTNPQAQNIYNKCKSHYSLGQEEEFENIFVPSIGFRIICGVVMYYNIISLILIIIKKRTYKKMNCNIQLLFLFSTGSFLSVIIFYFQRLMYYDFPCFVIPYVNAISFPLCFFSSSGIILTYLKQCYNNASLLSKHSNEENSKNIARGFLQKLCTHFTEKNLIKSILIYITISIFYVVFVSLEEKHYTLHPISTGFCTIDYELFPGSILLLVFIIGFLPMALYDLYMFRGNFSLTKTLSITMISTFICVLFFAITVFISNYSCRKISKYLPSEIYIIIFFFIFHITHITIPLIESYNVNKHIKGLDLTKKGLYKVFDDEFLYKEFFNYAVKKRSVEYALFHEEYMEFKSLFKSKPGGNSTSNQVSTIDTESLKDDMILSSLSTGTIMPNLLNKKVLQTFEQIYSKATDIFEKYFKEDSELELNLPGKLVKSVTNSYYDYTIYYNRYVVNGTGEHEIDITRINCESLFDDVHEEAMDSLFLNVYSSFAKDQKKILANENAHRGTP
ncbi:hypothetical protein BCR32DRAFT_293168 [Anaeromyces robustus]|uniref:Uncharacterized protein n=1 Tax=Anaeromyces robustus TaxID=1754192 RepID=A0A1Y1X7E1_9FUNG|nr:hypothetical protein BCR32DRAFT_293168 [Anaeromyces robustus]|eukprot:ORX81655.1 hypothetical protein BCR32DRAFT_293168 [Anaeromyces robustus]